MKPTRLFDFLPWQLANHPSDAAFRHEVDGTWRNYSTQEMIETANAISRGLIAKGIQPGDRIALASYTNRPEWVIADLAIQQIGAINVPVYPTISAAEYVYIFHESGVKLGFVCTQPLYEKFEDAKHSIPSMQDIYSFEQIPGKKHWLELMHDQGQEEIENRKKAIHPGDLATIIYTSGTTGEPKGVMLSHDNIVSNVYAVEKVFPVKKGESVLSFLPLCHIFERTASYMFTYIGVQVTFCGTDQLGGDEGMLKKVRPHFFTTVPRLLEKVYEKIYNKGSSLTGIKRKLFFWALSLTQDYEFDTRYSGLRAISQRIADKLIFSKWREALGGRVVGILTGAAPCPTHLIRIFSAAGIPIREGYGLTETSPGVVVGSYQPGGARMGTVGPLLDRVEVEIDQNGDYLAGEGEILVKGPNVMLGYYNKPEATAEVILERNGERWFRTGDIGKMVDGKYLKITDRKKELLKTSGGKYVAPAPIESALKENFMIEQALIVGDGRKFVSALLVPARDALQEWCQESGVAWKGLDEAIRDPKVVSLYERIIDSTNQGFSHIEQVKKFAIIPSTWEAERSDGTEAELTPTMKLKRRVIMKKYADYIEDMYAVS